tara:strand:+ start:1990 stop:2217 length:228 start_codon:yes stop_codon:yes gene_type:complete
MYFGDYLASQLEKHKMTQTDLAKILQVDTSLVSYWISSNRRPLLIKIPDIIGLFAKTKEEIKEHLYQIHYKEENK